jgi:hypothetical protein
LPAHPAGSGGRELDVDGVAELAFVRAERLFGGFAVGGFLLEAGAARPVGMPDLGDGGRVDGVAGRPGAAQREPVDVPLGGGGLDRRGAVAGGEPVPVTEPGHRPAAPMMAAAMTGPAPKMPVKVVPGAAAAAAGLARVPRRGASRRRRPAGKPAASSQRAAAAGPDGVMAGRRPAPGPR